MRTGMFTESTRKPTRPTLGLYLPPHMRSQNDNNAAAFIDTPELTHLNSIQPVRATRGGRGRGRGRGRGPWFSPRRNLNCEDHEKVDVPEEVTDDTSETNETNFEAYEDIPVQASGESVPSPVSTFAEIDLGDRLKQNLKRCNYLKPTPIQRHAIPIAVAGRDLMACAQTGSGKTAAFCFPIISGVLRDPLLLADRGGGVACPLSLILSPTRELSCQIHAEAKKYANSTGVKIIVLYGGTPVYQQLRSLENGVDILVATPGRLVDMIERGKVSLGMIKYLALDEADRMLDMGFEPQIRRIVENMGMPPPGTRQTMLFSATFPDEIQRLAADFLSDYIFLAVGRVGSSTDLIVQRVESVKEIDKKDHLLDLLRSQNSNATPHSKHALTVVFVETKRGANELERWLTRNGFPAIAMHGDKMQMEREQALRSFKSGVTPILVATDVASRGLDVPHVAHVINFDMPKNIDDYVHRIGRTGRAGKCGLATAFFTDKNLALAKSLTELMKESNQEVPDWLIQHAENYSTVGAGGWVRHGGADYGGYDFRKGSSSTYNDRYDVPGYYASGANAETFMDPNLYAAATYGYTYGYGSVIASGWD